MLAAVRAWGFESPWEIFHGSGDWLPTWYSLSSSSNLPIANSIAATFPISVILPLMGLSFAFGLDEQCFWSRDRGSQIIPMPTVSLARGSPVLFYAVPSRSGVFSLFNVFLRLRIECIVFSRGIIYFIFVLVWYARTSRLTMHKPVSLPACSCLEFSRISFWCEINFHG